MTHLPRLLGALTGAALLLGAATASAQDLKLYDWPSADAPVMVSTKGGVLFLAKDGAPLRAYSWKAKNGKKLPPLFITDIDRDGQPDLLGAGKPTFAIGSNSNPMWFQSKGCAQTVLGDYIADTKLDVACITGSKISVYSHDNQFAWSINLGRRVKACYAGDISGNNKSDLECILSGTKKIARVGGDGTLMTSEADDTTVDPDAPPFEMFADVGQGALDGQTFDFNKDGTPEEFLKVDDSLISVVSKSSPKALFTFNAKASPIAALVKDLDGDGNVEIVAISKKAIVVAHPSKKKEASYSLNTRKYKRKPLAELRSVYANNFADDAAAKASVDAVQPKLSKCYAGRAKKSGFTGSGQLLLQADVDDKGKVVKTSKIHSEIADKKVVSCALKALKKLKAPKAVEGANAIINITIVFTFRDS